MPEAFKKGEAPWEISEPQAGFKAGQAPWDQAPEAPEAPITEKFSGGESTLQGVGQGASLGYLPELQAGAEVALDRLLPERFGGQRNLKLKEALKQWRGRDQAIATEDPLAYGAGTVAGGAAIPIPGATVAKGGTMLTRAAKAVGTGAGLGFVANPGETDDQLQARLDQAKMGGALAAGGSALGKALSGAGSALKAGRQQLAFKLAGARKAHMKDIAKFKIGDDLEKFMQKEGMLKPGQTFETALEKSTAIVDDAGKQIGQTYKSVTDDLSRLADDSPEIAKALDKTKLTARDVAAEVLRKARQELRGTAEGNKALGQLRSEMKNLASLDRRRTEVNTVMKPGKFDYASGTREMIPVTTKTTKVPETPFEEILNYRKSLDDIAGYNKTFNESKTGQKALKIARNVIKEKLDKRIADVEAVSKLAGGDSGDRLKRLKELNHRYRMARNVQKMAEDRAAGEAAKANLGLLETIAGTGYAASEIARGEDPLKAIGKGIVGGIALRQARKYGPGIGYQTVRGAEALSRPLRAASKIPVGSYVVPWTLMNRENK
jgi:hypothetical protein